MNYLHFKGEMRELAAQVEPTNQTICQESQRIGAIALLEVDKKYGENSEGHLSHHATPHSIHMISRNIELLNKLYPYISEEHRPRIYDLAAISGAVHDEEQDLGPGANEKASGQYGVALARKSSDPEIRSEQSAIRIIRAVNGTFALEDKDAVVVQPNVCVGEPDPLVFTMAFADRNAIAMEGTPRMITDVTNLAFEWFKNPTVPQYKKVLGLQARFIKGGMGDEAIKPQLAYHFPDNHEEVFEILWDSYNPIIRSAYKAAMVLPKATGLDEALAKIVSAANPREATRIAQDKLSNIIH